MGFNPLESTEVPSKRLVALEKAVSKEQKSFAVPESGPRESGKDRSAAVTRRDSHPAKQKEKSKRVALIADQRVSGFDTGTLGPESFPKKSTADSKKLAARRRKD